MAKQNLFSNTVIRRDGTGGDLYLMNRLEGGWRSLAVPVASEEALLAKYNVRLGAWTRDEYSEYCPVLCLGREELSTIPPPAPDMKPVVIVDGLNVLKGYSLMGDGVISEKEAFEAIVQTNGGPTLMDDSYKSGPVLVDDGTTKKVHDLLDAHPELVEIGSGGQPFMVGDGITHETVRELARGRAGYSSALGPSTLPVDPYEALLEEGLRKVIQLHELVDTAEREKKP